MALRSAVRSAISDVMRGQHGESRALATNVFYRARFAWMNRDQKKALALAVSGVARHAFQIDLGDLPIADNAGSPIGAASAERIINIPVSIRLLTPVSAEECNCEVVLGEAPDEDVAESQDEAIDQLLSDLEDAVQALGAPHNLDTDANDDATNIVGGFMYGPLITGAPTFRVTREDWEMQFLESQIDGVVIVTIPANT